MPLRSRAPVRSGALAVVLVVLSALLVACGGSAGVAPPTGVDELQIPTSSPDPRDFVDAVDNPWLPLSAGSTWTYAIDSARPDGAARAVSTVLDEPAEVAGVAATQVRTVVTDQQGDVLRSVVASYAQDAGGNVWLLAARSESRAGGVPSVVSWAAGEGDARAGLAMAAHPRPGDGYEVEDAPGIAQDRARVVTVEAAQVVGEQTYDRLLVLDTSSALTSDTGREWYAEGTGLLLADRFVDGATEQWTLTAHEAGPGG